jgi:hypothetical protein
VLLVVSDAPSSVGEVLTGDGSSGGGGGGGGCGVVVRGARRARRGSVAMVEENWRTGMEESSFSRIKKSFSAFVIRVVLFQLVDSTGNGRLFFKVSHQSFIEFP